MVMYKGYSKEVKAEIDATFGATELLARLYPEVSNKLSSYAGLLQIMSRLGCVKEYRRYRNKYILRGNKRAIKKLNMAIRREQKLTRRA